MRRSGVAPFDANIRQGQLVHAATMCSLLVGAPVVGEDGDGMLFLVELVSNQRKRSDRFALTTTR